MNANETTTEILSIENGTIRERVTFRDGRSHVQYRPLATAKDIAAKVEAAAVTEATRLCDQAFAGLAKVEADPAVAPWLPARPVRMARAKRYQIEEFSRTSAKVARMVSEVHPSWEMASREEYLTAIDLYCAAWIAEVERRFRQVAEGA